MVEGLTHSPSVERLSLERRAFFDLVRMANTMASPEEMGSLLVRLAQHLSGCEAVAIRLKSGPGYPYAAHLGFPERFLSLEDELCILDEEGHLLRDENRQPVLACLCGRVLSQRLDPTEPGFTERGSFVTSPNTGFPPPSFHPKLQGELRNRCRITGFQTVGLFPIRREGVTYGLIQCNDPRPDHLRGETIALMEELADTAAHLFQLAMA